MTSAATVDDDTVSLLSAFKAYQDRSKRQIRVVGKASGTTAAAAVTAETAAETGAPIEHEEDGDADYIRDYAFAARMNDHAFLARDMPAFVASVREFDNASKLSKDESKTRHARQAHALYAMLCHFGATGHQLNLGVVRWMLRHLSAALPKATTATAAAAPSVVATSTVVVTAQSAPLSVLHLMDAFYYLLWRIRMESAPLVAVTLSKEFVQQYDHVFKPCVLPDETLLQTTEPVSATPPTTDAKTPNATDFPPGRLVAHLLTQPPFYDRDTVIRRRDFARDLYAAAPANSLSEVDICTQKLDRKDEGLMLRRIEFSIVPLDSADGSVEGFMTAEIDALNKSAQRVYGPKPMNPTPDDASLIQVASTHLAIHAAATATEVALIPRLKGIKDDEWKHLTDLLAERDALGTAEIHARMKRVSTQELTSTLKTLQKQGRVSAPSYKVSNQHLLGIKAFSWLGASDVTVAQETSSSVDATRLSRLLRPVRAVAVKSAAAATAVATVKSSSSKDNT